MASTGGAREEPSSLSSVVSNLVRAQMGTSLAPTVTDEDLDRHVAELILKEAKKKAERYAQHGVHAYTSNNSSDSNAPRPNKRFLTSIIKSTDDHNKTILKAQALAAQELKDQRAAQEREERRKRAEEAAEAERLRRQAVKGRRRSSGSRDARDYIRRSSSSSRRRRSPSREYRRNGSSSGGQRRRVGESDEGWDRWDGKARSAAERKRKIRDWATWKGEDSGEEKEEGTERRRETTMRSLSREHKCSLQHDSEVTAASSSNSSKNHHRERDRKRSRSPRGKRTEDQRKYDSTDEEGTHYRRSRDQKRIKGKDDKHRRRSLSRSPDSSHTAPSGTSHTPKPTRHDLDDLDDDPPPPTPPPPPGDTPPPPPPPLNPAPLDAEQFASSSKSSYTSPPLKRGRSPSPGPLEPSSSSSKRLKHKSKHSKRDTSRHRSRSRSPPPSSRKRRRSRSVTPGPEPAVTLPSKMDKYFEESYDPRLDIAPLTVPTVPMTGLINEAEYDGWDAMLALVRQRQQDREDRKVLERMGVTSKVYSDGGSSSKKAKKSAAASAAGVASSAAAAATRWGDEAANIMDIAYTKRGAVREWDLGKEKI